MVSQTIPLDATERQTFIPECLADQADPPTFTLGTPTRRDRRAMDMFIVEEGLRHYGMADIRAEFLTAIERLWEPEQAQQYRAMVEDYWSASDDWSTAFDNHKREQADLPDAERTEYPAFAFADQERVDLLEKRVTESWRPLREMAARNMAFTREQPRITIAFALKSWSGITVTLPSGTAQRDAGYLTLECVDAIETAMRDRFGDVLGNTAFMQLALACINRFFMLPVTEKNSPSPQPSAPTPTHTETDSASPNGTSPASEPSTETPADSSPSESSS